MKTIYVVSAFQGEYSDRTEWNIKAFSSEKSAQKFLISLEEEKRLERAERINKKLYHTYDDIYYSLEAIELEED